MAEEKEEKARQIVDMLLEHCRGEFGKTHVASTCQCVKQISDGWFFLDDLEARFNIRTMFRENETLFNKVKDVLAEECIR